MLSIRNSPTTSHTNPGSLQLPAALEAQMAQNINSKVFGELFLPSPFGWNTQLLYQEWRVRTAKPKGKKCKQKTAFFFF